MSLTVPTMTEEQLLPLHLAIYLKLPLMTKLIVEEFSEQVDLAGIDSKGNTAFHHAAESGSHAILTTLLELDSKFLF